MIKTVGGFENSFKADKHTINEETGKYKDPLMNWPLRGAAFSNEIGEALRPVIGDYATVSWAPALLYIGADVYDKYKNNQTEYSPDSQRCLKQAIFQGLASMTLPLGAIKAGQGIFAQAGKFTKDRISLTSKENVSKLAEEFIANGKMDAVNGREQECINEFKNIVSNSLDFKHNKKSLKNITRIFNFDKKDKIAQYSEKTITDLINMQKTLQTGNKGAQTAVPQNIAKWTNKYQKCLQSGQTENVAVKNVLTKFQQNKMLKGNFVKAIGGFVALAIAIKPIDNFVENVIIGKCVEPALDGYKNKHALKNNNKEIIDVETNAD